MFLALITYSPFSQTPSQSLSNLALVQTNKGLTTSLEKKIPALTSDENTPRDRYKLRKVAIQLLTKYNKNEI